MFSLDIAALLMVLHWFSHIFTIYYIRCFRHTWLHSRWQYAVWFGWVCHL